MLKPIFYGKIQNGILNLNDRKAFDSYLHSMSGEIQLTIGRKKKIRTTGKKWEGSNQNGYLYGVVLPILCKSSGEIDPDRMKYNLQRKFLRIGGTDDIPIVRRTSGLSTIEWEEFMSQIRIWADTELQTYIPQPNEGYDMH